MSIEIDILFRVIFVGIFLSTLSISAYHRRNARRKGGTIPRRDEGKLALFLRAAMALPLLAAIGAYIFVPSLMEWSTLSLPISIRWIGAGTAALCIPLLWWVFSSIGENISETVLTKAEHQLVTHGPYRWVRHPLYALSLVELLSLSVLANNWFMLLLSTLGVVIFRLIVIPKEEGNLIAAFGEQYEVYRIRTGALLPRVRR